MFGFEIYNNKFQRIIYGSEMAYHYWGKVIVSSNADHDEKITPLFNIPKHWSPMVFATATEIGRYPAGIRSTNYAYTTYHQDRICVISKRKWMGNIRQTFVFYVFVPAKYLPQSGWGLELYNEANELCFTGYRPPLNIKSFIPNNTNDNVQRYRDNFAVPTLYSGFLFIAFLDIQLHFTMMGSSIEGLRMLLHTQLSFSPGFEDQDFMANITEIPTINPDYYNPYPNLPRV
ncbi:TPA: hypothetical protein ACX6QL_003457 [Photobacterium damselae]